MVIKIKGMSCSHCVKRLENALLDGGAKNLKVKIGEAEFDGMTIEKATEIIEDLGFETEK